MRTTRKNVILFSAYQCRIQANEALTIASVGIDSSEALGTAAKAMEDTAKRALKPQVSKAIKTYSIALTVLSRLVAWTRAVRNAEVDADRYLRSAKVLARDLANDSVGILQDIVAYAGSVQSVNDIDEVPGLAKSLLFVPLPLPIFEQPETLKRTQKVPSTSSRKASEVVVAFTSFNLDGKPFCAPHTIAPNVIHDLEVEATVSRWPEGAQAIIFEPISVEPIDSYELPIFSVERPHGNPPYPVKKTGRLLLKCATSFFARPLEFAYRARFSPELSHHTVVFVEGQRHLRVQSFDPDRDPQSGYSQVDHKVLEIRNEVRRIPAVSDDEINSFLTLLTAVGRIAGESLQDNLFSIQHSEAKFQEEMKKLLRRDRHIGSELEEHPHVAGGITDLSFHRIRLELKVESENLVDIEASSKFVPQAAQYVAGSDRRFGVLAILDCSPKKTAPGSVGNDIFLKTDVPSPGDRLPICIAVVIIRGNLSKPSNLSR
jgi:hypothetical protein